LVRDSIKSDVHAVLKQLSVHLTSGQYSISVCVTAEDFCGLSCNYFIILYLGRLCHYSAAITAVTSAAFITAFVIAASAVDLGNLVFFVSVDCSVALVGLDLVA
ncbi:serine/threonine-protein kinase svkA, partial [Biomphalaria glabrata]